MPVDAILFRGRRASNMPLVVEQYKSTHGVFIGALIASEVTVTAMDVKTGSLRHDPLAMLSFCGHHMADYWGHWLELQEKLSDKFPKVFQVSWFRKGSDSKSIRPGYGENSRVLDWIIRQIDGQADAVDGVTGRYPKFEDFNLDGIDVDEATWDALFETNPDAWTAEMDEAEGRFEQLGDELPIRITGQLAKFRERIAAAKARLGLRAERRCLMVG